MSDEQAAGIEKPETDSSAEEVSDAELSIEPRSPDEQKAFDKLSDQYDFTDESAFARDGEESAESEPEPEPERSRDASGRFTSGKSSETEDAPDGNPAVEKQAEKPFSGITEDQLYRAAQVGLTPADIARLKTPEAVDAAIAYGQSLLQMRHFQQAQQQAQQAQSSQFAEFSKDFEKLKKEMIDQGYDEAIVNRMIDQEKQISKLARFIEQQNDQLQRFSQWSQQAHQQQVVSNLENQVNVFAEKNKELFGDLFDDQESRKQVLGKALMLGAGYQQAGVQPPPLEQLLKEASYAVSGDKLMTIARNKVRGEVAKARARESSRPRGDANSSNTPEGDKGAIRHVANVFKRIGLGRG
jgi:ribosome-binding protein aMBF1 (putative translation factor)